MKFISGFFNSLVFGIILYASYLLILLSLPYIHFIPGVEFLATKQLIYHIDAWRISFYVHVFTSPIVILAGLFQFNGWILRNKPKLHRLLGMIYVIVVLFVTGPAALIMSLYANGGRVAQTSFVILSCLWILFTFLAYRKVRKHDYSSHIKWMIRSYALTLSAVTLRFYAYLFDVFNLNLGPKETYILLAYLSWIPNLIFAEILMRAGYLNYLLKRMK